MFELVMFQTRQLISSRSMVITYHLQYVGPSPIYFYLENVAFHPMVVDEFLYAHFLTGRIASEFRSSKFLPGLWLRRCSRCSRSAWSSRCSSWSSDCYDQLRIKAAYYRVISLYLSFVSWMLYRFGRVGDMWGECLTLHRVSSLHPASAISL